ncbi:MAG: hypothetical protein Q8L68_05395, partial [Methylococcales bacterium]|nr:hypothetical protein [Methylococcales bacterium]
TVISSWTGSGNLNNTGYNFSISGYSGQSYFVHVAAQHNTYGTVHTTYAVKFDKTIEVTGIPNKFWLWFAISMMFFLGAVFTYRTAEHGALLICIMGWIFLAVGAFDSINKTQMGIGLSFATIIAIFALIKKHSREEGYS